MDLNAAMCRIDDILSHVWMVRTFLKHCEEVDDDEELQSVHRTLYDGMHALGSAFEAGNAEVYLKQLRKKLPKMRNAAKLFDEIQPEISSHTNFLMARRSLASAMQEIDTVLGQIE